MTPTRVPAVAAGRGGIPAGDAVAPRRRLGLALAAAAAVSTACGGGTAMGPNLPAPPATKVFLVVEENTDYAGVIGNASMPYLNGLAQQYGLATQYYANTHPSIGNYFELTTGQIVTNDDGYGGTVGADNVVRELLAAGKTWRSYAEDLPSAGYTGGDTANYRKHHNPFAYLTDVVNSATEVQNLVPFTRFATDLAQGTLPDYSFIVPNVCDDAHDCSLATADTWLETNIAPLVGSATFQQGALLIVLFDEAGADNAHGGGRVAWVVVSPNATAGYRSATLYQHQSTLRLTLEALGVTVFPGAAAGARSMGEFFR